MPQSVLSPEEVRAMLASGRATPATTPAAEQPLTLSPDEVQALMDSGAAEIIQSTQPKPTTPTAKPPAIGSFGGFPYPTASGVSRVLSGAKDAVVGAAAAANDYLSDPLTSVSPGISFAKKFIYDPAYEQGQKAGEALMEDRTSEFVGHTAAGLLPGVGPMAAHVGERIGAGETPEAIGEVAAGFALPKVVGTAARLPGAMIELGRNAKTRGMSVMDAVDDYKSVEGVYEPTWTGRGTLSSTPVRANINNLATISRLPAMDIVEVHPLMKEWMQLNRLDPNKIAITETAPKWDLVGDLQRGLSRSDHNLLAHNLKKDPRRTGSLVTEAASGVVDLANRPFEQALKIYGDVNTRDLAVNIEGNLRKAAADTIDDGLKRNYLALAEKVRAEGGTARGLNDVKVWANKESAALHALTPGGFINATARPVAAYADVGSMIRRELYPRLNQVSKGHFDLSEAGRIESQAIKFRDNVYKTWDEVAAQHAAETVANANESRLLGMTRRVNPFTQNKLGMTLNLGRGVAEQLGQKRALLQDYNRMFKEGVGGVQGWTPDNPTTMTLLAELTREQKLKERMAGAQQLDLVGHDLQLPLFETPGGMSSNIGQAIQGVQMRADRQARLAPPPTLAGEQPVLPERPFYPGPEVTGTRKLPDGSVVPEHQGQLFSLYQDLTPAERLSLRIQEAQKQARALTTPPQQRALPPAPAPTVSIPGEAPVATVQQVRGVDAPLQGSRSVPHTSRTGAQETQWPTVFKGEASTDPLRRPAGPGTLKTSDPKVVANTLAAINEELANPKITAKRKQELTAIRANLLEAIRLSYPPALQPPPSLGGAGKKKLNP